MREAVISMLRCLYDKTIGKAMGWVHLGEALTSYQLRAKSCRIGDLIEIAWACPRKFQGSSDKKRDLKLSIYQG